METSINKNGCSTCEVGKEKYTTFEHRGKTYYQYDYRHTAGRLFSTTGSSVAAGRASRDLRLKVRYLGTEYSNIRGALRRATTDRKEPHHG